MVNKGNPLNRDVVKGAIDGVLKKWDVSGGFVLQKDKDILYKAVCGFRDREKGLATQPDSSYVIRTETDFFVGIAILKLLDLQKIKLSDKLGKYVPQYKHGDKITIKHLLKNRSGIPDFYNGHLMVALENDEAHKALETQLRLFTEHRTFYQNANFDKMMAIVGDLDLLYKPGDLNREESKSDWIMLAQVIRVVTGIDVYSFLDQHFFKPLKMDGVRRGWVADTVSYVVHRHTELVPIPLDSAGIPQSEFLTMTLDDGIKLLQAMADRSLFSEKTWALALTYDENNMGLVFENANGYDCFNASFLGSGYFGYFNHNSGIWFLYLLNETQKLAYENHQWSYVKKEMREAIGGLTTFPAATKMVALNKKNYWDALDITVAEDQQEFVLDAKSSCVMALMHKTKKAFVQMEGNQMIGLLVVDVDKKKDYFHIDIIQIDKRFQGKGYGKLMVKWAVSYLTEKGAKELKIGVARYNFGAQKIYMAAGFTPHSVYGEGMELALDLRQGTESVTA